MEWTALSTTGTPPCARGGHTVRARSARRSRLHRQLDAAGLEALETALAAIASLLLAAAARRQLLGSGKQHALLQVHAQFTHPQATLVGEQLYVFGGEDAARRPLADLHILDLSTLAWRALEVPGKAHAKPPPRCGHAAVVHHDKLIVFGGEWGTAHVRDAYLGYAACTYLQTPGQLKRGCAQ